MWSDATTVFLKNPLLTHARHRGHMDVLVANLWQPRSVFGHSPTGGANTTLTTVRAACRAARQSRNAPYGQPPNAPDVLYLRASPSVWALVTWAAENTHARGRKMSMPAFLNEGLGVCSGWAEWRQRTGFPESGKSAGEGIIPCGQVGGRQDFSALRWGTLDPLLYADASNGNLELAEEIYGTGVRVARGKGLRWPLIRRRMLLHNMWVSPVPQTTTEEWRQVMTTTVGGRDDSDNDDNERALTVAQSIDDMRLTATAMSDGRRHICMVGRRLRSPVFILNALGNKHEDAGHIVSRRSTTFHFLGLERCADSLMEDHSGGAVLSPQDRYTSSPLCLRVKRFLSTRVGRYEFVYHSREDDEEGTLETLPRHISQVGAAYPFISCAVTRLDTMSLWADSGGDGEIGSVPTTRRRRQRIVILEVVRAIVSDLALHGGLLILDGCKKDPLLWDSVVRITDAPPPPVAAESTCVRKIP